MFDQFTINCAKVFCKLEKIFSFVCAGGLSRRELEGRDRAARSSSSSESDGDGRSTSQALSTGGESRASSSVRVERVEVARSAISQAFSRAENDIRRGEPVQAVAESTAIAIGEAITAVVVETEVCSLCINQ